MYIFERGEYVDNTKAKEYSYDSCLKSKHYGANGKLLTQALLYESSVNDKSNIAFTLKDRDYITNKGVYLYSLYRLYMLVGDPTEYDFAETVFGSWKAWQAFSDMTIMREPLKEWRDELEIKQRSQALKQIANITESEKDSTALSAAKYLAEKGWDTRKAGRPTNKEIERERKIAAGISSETEDDFNRITKIY